MLLIIAKYLLLYIVEKFIELDVKNILTIIAKNKNYLKNHFGHLL